MLATLMNNPYAVKYLLGETEEKDLYNNAMFNRKVCTSGSSIYCISETVRPVMATGPEGMANLIRMLSIPRGEGFFEACAPFAPIINRESLESQKTFVLGFLILHNIYSHKEEWFGDGESGMLLFEQFITRCHKSLGAAVTLLFSGEEWQRWGGAEILSKNKMAFLFEILFSTTYLEGGWGHYGRSMFDLLTLALESPQAGDLYPRDMKMGTDLIVNSMLKCDDITLEDFYVRIPASLSGDRLEYSFMEHLIQMFARLTSHFTKNDNIANEDALIAANTLLQRSDAHRFLNKRIVDDVSLFDILMEGICSVGEECIKGKHIIRHRPGRHEDNALTRLCLDNNDLLDRVISKIDRKEISLDGLEYMYPHTAHVLSTLLSARNCPLYADLSELSPEELPFKKLLITED